MSRSKVVFGRDRLACSIWHDRIVVDPTGELMEPHPVASKVSFQLRQVKIEQIADGGDADSLHSRLSNFPHSWYPPHGQRLEESFVLRGVE